MRITRPTAFPATVCALLAATLPVAALPFDVPINSSQSVLTFELCVSGNCDADSSPVTGAVRIELDSVDLPAQIWMHDFDVYLSQSLDFYLSWSIFGSLTATGTNLALHYADPGAALGPVPVSGAAFTFPAVPATQAGLLTYHATGIPCAALQAAGQPCDAVRDLSLEPPSSSAWTGSVSTAARLVTLVTTIDDTQPLDPNNPTLGSLRVYGTIRGTAYVPRPPGDVDGDGDVDGLDGICQAECLAGPANPGAPPTCIGDHFAFSDLDADGDADLADAADLMRLLPP